MGRWSRLGVLAALHFPLALLYAGRDQKAPEMIRLTTPRCGWIGDDGLIVGISNDGLIVGDDGW